MFKWGSEASWSRLGDLWGEATFVAGVLSICMLPPEPQQMRIRFFLALISSLFAVGLPSVASAVRIEANLTVTYVDADLSGVLGVGFTGSGQWDVDAAGFGPCVSGGCLSNPAGITSYVATPGPLAMDVTLGLWSFGDGAFAGPQIDIWNDFTIASGTFDAWSIILAVYSGGWIPGSGGPALPLASGNFAVVQLFLADSTASTLSDGSFFLPDTTAPFDTFTFVMSEISPTTGHVRTLFSSEATSITVPEPQTAGLLLLGAASLAGAAARRRSGACDSPL